MTGVSFSVVIPSYNRAEPLYGAVRSALSQCRPPLEVLVPRIERRRYVQGFPPVRYIRQENAGAAAARNRGIRESWSDGIAFLDSDDVWEPEKLAVHAAVHARWPEVGSAISDSVIVDDHLRSRDGPTGFVRCFPRFRAFEVDPERFFRSALERKIVREDGNEYEVYGGDAFQLLLHGNFVQPSVLRCAVSSWKRWGDSMRAWHLWRTTTWRSAWAPGSRSP